MTSLVAIAATWLFAVSSSVAGAAQPSPSAATVVVNCQAELQGSQPCGFSLLGADFDVTTDGTLSRSAREGRRLTIRLPLAKNSRIERVLYGDVEGDLLLVYEVSDGESSTGTVVRLALPGLTIKWRLTVPSFNLSEGTIDRTRLYQAGFGFVAAIDLTRGVFAWQHRDLYDRRTQAFNAFDRPQIAGADVVFQEIPPQNSARARRTIRVRKDTGRIAVQ
jgi:hypothetical protein